MYTESQYELVPIFNKIRIENSLPNSFNSNSPTKSIQSIRKNSRHSSMKLSPIPPFNGGGMGNKAINKSKKCVASETINMAEGIIDGNVDDVDDDDDDNGVSLPVSVKKRSNDDDNVVSSSGAAAKKRSKKKHTGTNEVINLCDDDNDDDDDDGDVEVIKVNPPPNRPNNEPPPPPPYNPYKWSNEDTGREYGFLELDNMMKNHSQPFTVVAALTLQETRKPYNDIRPAVELTMHDATNYSMNVSDLDISGPEPILPEVTFGRSAPATLKACAEKFSNTPQVQKYNQVLGVSLKKALGSGHEEVIIDENVTLFYGDAMRLYQLLEKAGAIPRYLFNAQDEMHGLFKKDKIAILYDKGSKRIYFIYYYLGFNGQWNKTEGNFARLLIKHLNERNPYLTSLSMGNNHNLEQYR